MNARRRRKLKRQKRNQGRRIVEQGTGGFLQQSSLFQQAMLHHVAQALALRDFSKDLVQRRAPFQGRDIRLAQHGSQNPARRHRVQYLCDKGLGSGITRSTAPASKSILSRSAGVFFLFLQLPLQKGSQPISLALSVSGGSWRI